MSDRKLIPIKPDELRAFWLEIRDEVASVEAPEGLIPEDVYAACKAADNAVLFLLMVEGARVGWMVLRSFGSDLHIWLLHAKPGFDVLTVFRSELMELARSANARKLTFGTKRRGWERVAPRHGFRVRQTIFECPVDACVADGGA